MATAYQASPSSYASERVFRSRHRRAPKPSRTEARILWTFSELLAKQPFGSISVLEIADRCGIARSTAYRHFATTTEMLWAISAPCFENAMQCALTVDIRGFTSACEPLWAKTGLARALADPKAGKVRQKLATLAAASLERVWRNRNAQAGGAIISGAWFALIDAHPDATEPPSLDLAELTTIIYTAAFLTPQGLKAMASARSVPSSAFPQAVSARESLASDDYIVSMIDGKPYRLLTRHIARFGMTPADYRRCFSLPADYPMAAKRFSELKRGGAERERFGHARSVGNRP